MTGFFPAGNKIVTFSKFVKKMGNFLGVVLEIAVEGKNEVSFGIFESKREGGGFTKITTEFENFDGGVLGVELLEFEVGFIG